MNQGVLHWVLYYMLHKRYFLMLKKRQVPGPCFPLPLLNYPHKTVLVCISRARRDFSSFAA